MFYFYGMIPAHEDKLANAIIALHKEMREMRAEFRSEIKGLRAELRREIKSMRAYIDRELGKIHLHLKEHSLSIMRLADCYDELRKDVNELRKDVDELRKDVNELRKDVDDLSANFIRYTRSNDAVIAAHEIRIGALENKSAAGYLVSEPGVQYKRKKRKR